MAERDRSVVSVPGLLEMKRRGEKIGMLTAYDYPTARILDRAGADALLVGDSLGMVVLGHDSTVYVTLEDMIHHTRAVVRGAERSLVITDLPFGSYEEGPAQALRSAVRLVKEGGCTAVKLEGGSEIAASVRAIAAAGVPVVGHVGLTPQSSASFGGFRVRAKTAQEARDLLQNARALEEAGAFMIVAEAVPAPVGELLSQSLTVPVIGIGAGAGCDGQVLVSTDMLGIQEELTPRYLKRYAALSGEMDRAVRSYLSEVKGGVFPGEEHVYDMQSGERDELQRLRGLEGED
ncbi:3-methyl-2-oxobutanoate hydroxymethyltransferase [soil metagenome]